MALIFHFPLSLSSHLFLNFINLYVFMQVCNFQVSSISAYVHYSKHQIELVTDKEKISKQEWNTEKFPFSYLDGAPNPILYKYLMPNSKITKDYKSINLDPFKYSIENKENEGMVREENELVDQTPLPNKDSEDSQDSIWTNIQLPLFILIPTIICIFAIGILMILWIKSMVLISNKLKKNPGDLTNSTLRENQQWIFHPILKPELDACNAEIQPQEYSILPEVMRRQRLQEIQPVHIKAKGLLERRGSSASLTIDLQRSTENLTSKVTPTRECTTEEYLLSAGNVLSRKQLRSCLLDVKALHKEFVDLPLNHPEKSLIPGSGTKNRYRSIFPNENTRVRLPVSNQDLLAGYINANYVRGYDGEEKAYIATQGPLPHTIGDFWLMVWNERIFFIVMITKLFEKGNPKCDAYFPGCCDSSKHTETYGDFTVSVINIIERDGYTIRDLLVKFQGQTRTVQHFWYDSWPDHKIPESPLSLVSMASEVERVRQLKLAVLNGSSVAENNGSNSSNCYLHSPVLVHCSAGIGRTGCFIALSVGMTQLIEENNVDILGVVCQLRYDRGGMVQTPSQYEFVHRALTLYERTLPEQAGE